MAASKSMLESLLSRVRQRASEPRAAASPRVAAPPPALPGDPVTEPPPSLAALASQDGATPLARKERPLAVAKAVPLSDDEIEDYEDELIEIIDDEEPEPDSEPAPASTSLPLELSHSAPQVEMRRRDAPLSARPRQEATPAAAPVAARGLEAETVARRPLGDAAVVAGQGQRPDPRSLPFVELLDASLGLGG